MTILEQIIEFNPDSIYMIADGFENAIIGFDIKNEKIVYSMKKCMDILMQDGMNFEDAMDYLGFNVIDAYVGEHTPIFCYDLW